jgi:acetyltransferase-like isoleucine patch superfamily enzyme
MKSSNNGLSEKPLHEQLADTNKSAIQRYQELALGTSSWWYLIKYELIMLVSSWVPGAFGLVLRKFLYPFILRETGSNLIIGRGVTIRHGVKVKLGDNVVLDDGCLLDAKGSSNHGISIGSNTIVSRNAVLSCKNGDISIGEACTIGINSVVHAMEGSDVQIGNDVLAGAFCYFIGSGPYISDELDIPFKKQGMIPQGGISIADNVWLGSNVQVLDGVKIQQGAIIGTSAVVNKDVDSYAVMAGIPARKIKSRLPQKT